MIYIVDVIRDVVAACSAALLPTLQAKDPLITGIRYEYGHYTDIQERLQVYKQQQKHVYPLIALFEDFRIQHGKEGTDGIGNLKIIILYISKNDITRQQREDNVFRPILYPIYTEFLRQLKLSGKFQIYDESKIVHDQINRPHWGDPGLYKSDGYLFNDILDGIELANIQLITYQKTC